MRLFFICLILSTHVFGQNGHQPQKESHLDIRSSAIVFSIADLPLKKSIWLERTPNLEYFLKLKQSEQLKIIKISSREASRLDREFASRFLKCQYELPQSPKDCVVTLRLTMKSEAQEICEKEDQKTQEMVGLFKKLHELF
jgi:hypothetical protein